MVLSIPRLTFAERLGASKHSGGLGGICGFLWASRGSCGILEALGAFVAFGESLGTVGPFWGHLGAFVAFWWLPGAFVAFGEPLGTVGPFCGLLGAFVAFCGLLDCCSSQEDGGARCYSSLNTFAETTLLGDIRMAPTEPSVGAHT